MKKLIAVALPILIVLAVAAFLGINYAVDNILPSAPIRPKRITAEEIRKAFGGPLTPSSVGLEWKPFDITVEDSIRLRGWFILSAKEPATGTIFLLHGIGSSKEFMLPMAAVLAPQGFNAVLYDSRANGESGGLNCSFGYFEKRDLSKYIDSAEVRFPGSGPYGVFGSSLGAAVAVQAMAVDTMISCGIVESPFATLRTVIHDYFARMVHIRADFIADRALVITERIARFPVDSVQPALAAKLVFQPTMVIHGLADDRIHPDEGKQVFDNLSSGDKVWYPVPGGGHDDLHKAGGKDYERRIVEFFKEHMQSR